MTRPLIDGDWRTVTADLGALARAIREGIDGGAIAGARFGLCQV